MNKIRLNPFSPQARLYRWFYCQEPITDYMSYLAMVAIAALFSPLMLILSIPNIIWRAEPQDIFLKIVYGLLQWLYISLGVTAVGIWFINITYDSHEIILTKIIISLIFLYVTMWLDDQILLFKRIGQLFSFLNFRVGSEIEWTTEQPALPTETPETIEIFEQTVEIENTK